MRVGLRRMIDYAPIRSGRVVVVPNWLEPPLVAAMRDEVRMLVASNQFYASGVAVGGADGEYGAEDRSVCVVSREPGSARAAVDERIDRLCLELRHSLQRPTLSCAGERYFSISRPGARLDLHMDERHEETKGERGWTTPSRRSVSWLLYLSDRSCEGGRLRAFCRRPEPSALCGAHQGDLQVGWLDGAPGSAPDVPIFLDSWVREAMPLSSDEDPHPCEWRPRSALYRLRDDSSKREYVSRRFGPDDATWTQSLLEAMALEVGGSNGGGGDDDDDGVTPAAFGAALRAQVPADLTFSGLEETDHPNLDLVDVAPTGGTLVLFDSVCVPHVVQTTTAGERLALAGWLHEEQQEPPEWFGT